MNSWGRFWGWYNKHQTFQWLIIIIPLWLQPLHMWAMSEQTLHAHGMVNITQIQYHLTHWNFWTDLFWLSIDYLEFISISAGTIKFINWLKTRNFK